MQQWCLGILLGDGGPRPGRVFSCTYRTPERRRASNRERRANRLFLRLLGWPNQPVCQSIRTLRVLTWTALVTGMPAPRRRITNCCAASPCGGPSCRARRLASAPTVSSGPPRGGQLTRCQHPGWPDVEPRHCCAGPPQSHHLLLIILYLVCRLNGSVSSRVDAKGMRSSRQSRTLPWS